MPAPPPVPILLLHSSAGRYGADLQLLAIAGGIDGERFEPIAVLPERGELAPLLEERGVEVLVHPLAVLRRGLANPRGIARILRAMRHDRRVLGELARSRGARVVHSNTSVVLSGPQIARAAGAASVIHVREIYDGAATGGLSRAWPALRRRLQRADALLCVSAAVASQFGTASNARVLHDGLVRIPRPQRREEARRTLGLPAGTFVVALLGRVSDWKGQNVLARALAEPGLAGIAAIGLVAGDAFPGREADERALERMRDELALGDRLRLLGFRDDVETILGAADAVAVPSTRPDPFPNSALESAAAGLPVVAAAHGGLPEIVSHGRTGMLVPPGDHAALAAALAELAADPDARRSLGAAAAADVAERFALGRMLSAVERVYEDASGGARHDH